MHVLFRRVFFSGKFECHISNQFPHWVRFKAILLRPESETGQNQHPSKSIPFQVFNVPLGICSTTK